MQKEKYSTAQKFFLSAFEQYKDQNTILSSRSQYYIAYCAVRLFNDDAEYYTLKFIGENPDDPLVNEAYFNLAGYFYARKKWNKSLEYYERTDIEKLTRDQWSELYFKQGYAYFSLKEFGKARVAFYHIIDLDTKYTSPALYYYSHIHYDEENYQTALKGFLRLMKDKTFGPVVPYYIVQIYYKQGRYQEITEFAPGIIDNVTEKRLPEVTRILAAAYAHLGKYPESLPYYTIYLDSASTVTKEDKYEAGYAFYKAEQYGEAITILGEISSTNSELGQNAAYYLADCFLKTGDKPNARLAFQSAAAMNFDPAIEQDALFNYAMISYELGSDPFNEAIRAFQEFIDKYPESKRIDEAYRFLIQAYMNARNYGLAMASLERANLMSDELKAAYQKIAFYRGVELFNNLDYPASIILFDKSLTQGDYDKLLKARALFWKAEALYRTEKYPQAVQNYKLFKNVPAAYTLEEYDLIDYNLGYAYFHQEDFGSAIEFFRTFVSAASEKHAREKGDALNRIGDGYYAKKDYYAAADFYTRSIDYNQTDVEYAMLQLGICQGLINKDIQKIKTLQDLAEKYPRSIYADDALHEMAQSYIKLQNTERAIEKLKLITTDYATSVFAPAAYVQTGLLYYNVNNNELALKYYQEAVRLFPGTQEAQDALVGMKNIYVDQNQVDEYFRYVNSLGESAPVISASEQDSLSYISAEKIYMAGNCENAAESFEKYISSFPEGAYLLKANFYKGDCYYQKKEFDKALLSFNYILGEPLNMFTEQALLGAARIEMRNKDYDKARQHYLNLIQNFSNPSNAKEARIAIMRADFGQKNYPEALKSAREVSALTKLSPEVEREAIFIIAKSLQETGRDVLAIEEYKKISDEVMSAEGAEAKYQLAKLYYDRKEYAAAEKVILDFSEKTTPHEYWIARSFILWADIFAVKKEYFQAIQTLQSIIDYYEVPDDGILELAKTKKTEIIQIQEMNEQPADKEDVEINIE
jgi:tetratricopeptide (TPR) repeat protein